MVIVQCVQPIMKMKIFVDRMMNLDITVKSTMGIQMLILDCKGKVALPLFLVANSNWQDLFSHKSLSANGFSWEGHFPVSLFSSFWFFVSGTVLRMWLHFGLMQAWKPVISRMNTASNGTLPSFETRNKSIYYCQF